MAAFAVGAPRAAAHAREVAGFLPAGPCEPISIWRPTSALPLAAHATSGAQVGRHGESAAVAAGVVAAALAAAGRRQGHGRRSGRSRWRISARARGGQDAKAFGGEEVLDVVIVGAGVSGLSAAFKLKQQSAGASVVVTEARDRVGGNITTRSENGRIWEEGPNSFQPGDPILATACDVGLRDDILLADPGSYRFVWWEGRLRPLPAGPVDAVFGDFLSLPGKIRAGLGAIGIKDPMPDHEETIREFVTRNLGEEAFERLIDPFVSGVYAGDPSKLSAEVATGRVQVLEKRAGSLVAGALELFQERAAEKQKNPRDPRLPEVKGQTVGSFRGGLRQFAEALGENLAGAGSPVRLNWKLQGLQWDAERQVHVLNYETPLGPARLMSRALVLTAPSYVTADLLRPLSADAAGALDEIRYPCVAAVTVEYPRSALREPEHGKGPVNGFGQLHPRSQGIRTLGTIYSSSLFPNREPDSDKVMLLHYIGGDRDPELYGGIADLSDGDIVDATHRDAITTLLKPSAGDQLPQVLSVRKWLRAIPQCELGHTKRLDRAKQGLAAAGVKGLYLAGNYVGGVALGRCVEYGLEIGGEVAKFVRTSQPERV